MPHTVPIEGVDVDAGKLAALCQAYEVRRLAVFGSAVRKELGTASDIDLMVEFHADARIGLLKFESLVEDLEALFQRKVDLVTMSGLKSWIRPYVLKEAHIIYEA